MDLHPLALTVHLVGMGMWIGALVALASTLVVSNVHGEEARRSIALGLAKGAARAADVAALVAIVGGLWLLSFSPAFYMHQPWMHSKLTLVVVLLGLHGVVRARAGRASRGPTAPFPSWVLPVLVIVTTLVVALAVMKPWAKMIAMP